MTMEERAARVTKEERASGVKMERAAREERVGGRKARRVRTRERSRRHITTHMHHL